MLRSGIHQGPVSAQGPPKSSQGTAEVPKKGLARVWETVKMLYENDVTRSIGRDFVFFAGAVVVIRIMVAALDEPPAGVGVPGQSLPPLPGPK